jgi:hypothetical protein
MARDSTIEKSLTPLVRSQRRCLGVAASGSDPAVHAHQLAGRSTIHFIVPKLVNWVINIIILTLIMASYAANRMGYHGMERRLAGVLVVLMVIIKSSLRRPLPG